MTPEQLEALSKAASPALGVSVKALAQLLRLGAEHQRPRADNWDTFPAEQDAEFVCTLVNLYRQGQLVAVDDGAVERESIFRQIGRWEMAQEIAIQLATPVKDCTPGAAEQASFNTAAKLVSMSISTLASLEFSKLPVCVQFDDGEWGPIMADATAALAALKGE